MYPDGHAAKSMSMPMQAPQPQQSHMHEAVTRVESIVADIEHNLEILQSRLEPVVFHRPAEVAVEAGDRPLCAPLAAEIHNLADRLAGIRFGLTHTLESLEL